MHAGDGEATPRVQSVLRESGHEESMRADVPDLLPAENGTTLLDYRTDYVEIASLFQTKLFAMHLENRFLAGDCWRRRIETESEELKHLKEMNRHKERMAELEIARLRAASDASEVSEAGVRKRKREDEAEAPVIETRTLARQEAVFAKAIKILAELERHFVRPITGDPSERADQENLRSIARLSILKTMVEIDIEEVRQETLKTGVLV